MKIIHITCFHDPLGISIKWGIMAYTGWRFGGICQHLSNLHLT